jgi:hypothetical protein
MKHYNKAIAGKCLTVDSVIKYDTIRGWSFDATFISDTTHDIDTFLMENGTESVRTIVKWKERTVLQKKIETDTIIKSVDVTKKVIEKVEVIPFWVKLVLITAGVIILGLIFRGK